jgi:hypothetical protein
MKWARHVAQRYRRQIIAVGKPAVKRLLGKNVHGKIILK